MNENFKRKVVIFNQLLKDAYRDEDERGMADGISGGMDGRITYKACMTALGNAVVPQQFYPIFRAIAETERMENQIN